MAVRRAGRDLWRLARPGGTGLWLEPSPLSAALFDPYIKAMNAMPRVILAVWFGLGVASKVALGVALVFLIVFFNVYEGVKEARPQAGESGRKRKALTSMLRGGSR